MRSKIILATCIFVGLIIAFFVITEIENGFKIIEANAQPAGGNILYVGGSGPNNYTTIQDAINAANDGDTIFVYSGVYYENVVVNKSITLRGETVRPTIVGGLNITANNVTLFSFRIENNATN